MSREKTLGTWKGLFSLKRAKHSSKHVCEHGVLKVAGQHPSGNPQISTDHELPLVASGIWVCMGWIFG